MRHRPHEASAQEPEAFQGALDMVRKLRDPGDGDGYTATALVLAEWDDPRGSGSAVRVREAEVPSDVAAPQFFSAMVRQVSAAAPEVHHVAVRGLLERRHIPVVEADAVAEDGSSRHLEP